MPPALREQTQSRLIMVRESAIHGRGCFAATRIVAGSRIVEYTGRRISVREANERYWERPNTYLLHLGDGTVIDGLGIASLVNHSCEPNCRAETWQNRVWICALRDILPDEEITFDYNLGNSGDAEMPCRCGAVNCRGTMFSQEELRRRRQRQKIREGERGSAKRVPRSRYGAAKKKAKRS